MNIIPQPKQLTFWEHTQSPSEDGSEKVKSNRIGRRGDSAASSKGKSKDSLGFNCQLHTYRLFRKQVEHFCAKLELYELYSMQTKFSYGTLLSGP